MSALARFALRPVAAVCAVLAAVLTALSGRYGYHRDELYFLVAGDHPAFGYVDQPPLTPLLAKASTAVFGDTLMGLRVVATLMAVAAVVVVALIARELGGDGRVQTVAAVLAATSGYLLGNGHMVSTSTFDLLIWLVISWLVVRVLRTGDARWFLAVGAAIGVGVQNKYLVLLLVAGLLGSVLLVGPRRVLGTWWFVAGIAVAVAIALPNVLWQQAHDWPQWTVASGISSDDGVENRVLFVPLQLVYLSPLYVPIMVAGWLRLWRTRSVRAFAVAYPLLAVLMIAAGGKSYYVVTLLLVVLAAGVSPALDWASSVARRRVVVAAVVVGGLVSAVVTLPVLPPSALSGLVNGMNKEQGEQVGWPSVVDAVAVGWSRIPEPDRSRAVILAQNYSMAGAVDRFGAAHGLPQAYSGHMSFYDWGPPPDTSDGPVLLVRYPGNRVIGRHFVGCAPVATVDNGHGLENDEQGSVVVLCTGADGPWSRIWPDLRRFY